MHMKDILLVVDYHLENLEIRRLNGATGEERRWKQPTTRQGILEIVEAARKEIAPGGGQVFWIMESTTGWARVKELIGDRVQFVLANVTDDAQLVEATGQAISVVLGDPRNIKITTRGDLALASAVMGSLPKPKPKGSDHPFSEAQW